MQLRRTTIDEKVKRLILRFKNARGRRYIADTECADIEDEDECKENTRCFYHDVIGASPVYLLSNPVHRSVWCRVL